MTSRPRNYIDDAQELPSTVTRGGLCDSDGRRVETVA
jgi:hypothetical protein